MNYWTKEEEALLRSYFPTTLDAPPELIARHSLRAIYQHARKLHLTPREHRRHRRCVPGIKERLVLSMTPEEIAYMAGIFDGEGNVNTYRSINTTCYSEVGICNISLALIEWLAAHVPGSVYYYRPPRPHPNVISRHPLYDWKLRGQLRVHDFLEVLFPYLIVKREKAATVITTIKAKYPEYLSSC